MSRKELITTYFTGLAVLAMILALAFTPVHAEEYTLRGLRKIVPPTDVMESLEFEIGVYPTIVDNGMRFPILREKGHGFSFISVGIWFQNLPGGKGGPWALCLAAADSYKDVMIKKRARDFPIKGIDLMGGIGYQYFIEDPRMVFMVGLRMGSVTLGYRPDKEGRITLGVEVR